MDDMFKKADSFNQDISKWETNLHANEGSDFGKQNSSTLKK